MKQLPPHLQIFTPESPATASCSEFVAFSRLPPELRQKIWKQSLERQRILRLSLNLPAKGDGNEKSVQNGAPCAISTGGKGLFSKLLRVTREARYAALAFYRAHLSCKFAKDDERLYLASVAGVLYINPEFDFLQLEGVAGRWAPPFLHHFKTAVDPSRRGVRNLALNMTGLSALSRRSDNAEYGGKVGRSVAETLHNLEEVWFVDHVGTARFIPGAIIGPNPNRTVHTRSYPLYTCGTTFERLPLDPRPIEADLSEVYVDPGLVDAPRKWAHLLDLWGVGQGGERLAGTSTTTYRYCLSCSAYGGPVRDRDGAEAAIRREDDYWNGRLDESTYSVLTPIPCE
ncbi:hypothetical protein PG985_001530 [Apiospora marii]|uniref:2EXR domain-containing protein n=1 Tax=Apiospora marii TaxID=335849 RepID=A0ABR1RI84_9PEZI